MVRLKELVTRGGLAPESKAKGKVRGEKPQGKPRQDISHILKYVVFFINFFFWVCGLTSIGIGVYVLIDQFRPVLEALDFFLNPAILFILGGCIVFLISFLGCTGALRENVCMLKIFGLALFIAYICLVVLAFVIFLLFYSDSESGLSIYSLLLSAVKKYSENDNLKEVMDTMQTELKCCGATSQGYKDWNLNPSYSCSIGSRSSQTESIQDAFPSCSVPHSCCIPQDNIPITVTCGADALRKSTPELEKIVHTDGCLRKLRNAFEGHAVIIGAVIGAIIVPVCVSITFSNILWKQIERQRWRLERQSRREERWKRRMRRKYRDPHQSASAHIESPSSYEQLDEAVKDRDERRRSQQDPVPPQSNTVSSPASRTPDPTTPDSDPIAAARETSKTSSDNRNPSRQSRETGSHDQLSRSKEPGSSANLLQYAAYRDPSREQPHSEAPIASSAVIDNDVNQYRAFSDDGMVLRHPVPPDEDFGKPNRKRSSEAQVLASGRYSDKSRQPNISGDDKKKSNNGGKFRHVQSDAALSASAQKKPANANKVPVHVASEKELNRLKSNAAAAASSAESQAPVHFSSCGEAVNLRVDNPAKASKEHRGAKPQRPRTIHAGEPAAAFGFVGPKSRKPGQTKWPEVENNRSKSRDQPKVRDASRDDPLRKRRSSHSKQLENGTDQIADNVYESVRDVRRSEA